MSSNYVYGNDHILSFDKNNPMYYKIISEDTGSNKYTLIFTSFISLHSTKCIYKLSFDIQNGELEIRYFTHGDNEDPMTVDLSKRGNGNKLFFGNYKNVVPYYGIPSR